MPGLILAGQKFNLFERGEWTEFVNVAFDANYPKENAYDGRPLRPARFTSASGSMAIKLFNQILFNGRFDTWGGGLPTFWTKVNAGDTVTQENADRFVASGSAAKLTPAGTSGYLRQDVVVRSGEYLRIIGAMHRLTNTDGVVAYVQNLTTGRYLRGSDLTWQTAVEKLWLVTSATYVNNTVDFQVESYAACKAPLVTLRILVGVEQTVVGNGGVFDEFYLVPGVDFLSVHGHNLAGGQALGLFYSADNFVGESVNLATPPVNQPALYYWTGGAKTYRAYWLLQVSGTHVSAPGFGELVLGQAKVLGAKRAHPARSPWATSYDRAQIRHETDAGDAYAFNRSGWRRRILKLPYALTKDADMQEMLDEVRTRCEDGVHPLVVVPSSDDPHVIHGRIEKAFETRQAMRDASGLYHELDLVVRESGFPNFAA